MIFPFVFIFHPFVDGDIVRREMHKRISPSGSHFLPRGCTRVVSVSADLPACLHLYLFPPLRDGTHSQISTHGSFFSASSHSCRPYPSIVTVSCDYFDFLHIATIHIRSSPKPEIPSEPLNLYIRRLRKKRKRRNGKGDREAEGFARSSPSFPFPLSFRSLSKICFPFSNKAFLLLFLILMRLDVPPKSQTVWICLRIYVISA